MKGIFLQLNQFGSTQSSYFIAAWIWILPRRRLWPPLWLSVVRRSLYSCIVIFSAESSGLETAPSLAEQCKWFELCSFSLVSCSIFCLMPCSWFFLRGGWKRLRILKLWFVQSGSAVRHLWGQNSPAMLTVPPVFALQKDPRGLFERNLKWVTVSLQSSPHYIRRSYCLLLQGAYCTFTPHASSLYSSTTDCLSALHIVISPQPRLCCITATQIYRKPPSSCVPCETCRSPDLNYSVSASRGDVCKGNIFLF